MEGMDKDSAYFHVQETSTKLASRAEALNLIEEMKYSNLVKKIEKREKTQSRRSDAIIDSLKDKLLKMRAYRQVLNTRYNADKLAALTTTADLAAGGQVDDVSPQRRYTGAVILKRGFSMELLKDEVDDVIRTDYDTTAKKQKQREQLLVKAKLDCANALRRSQRTGIFKGTLLRLPPLRVHSFAPGPEDASDIEAVGSEHESHVGETFLTRPWASPIQDK